MTLPIQKPAIVDHCMAAYEAMEEEAVTEDEGLVYEGFLTKLILQKLNLSMPYYTKVTKELKRMGCIHQLRRGGSTTPSRWMLLREPTMTLYEDSPEPPEFVGTDRLSVVEQRVRDNTERLNVIFDYVGYGD